MQFDFRQELGKVTPKIAKGANIYFFGTGAYLEYVCKQYKYMVNIDITNCINGFIDNDIKKQGTLFRNKPIYNLDEIDAGNSVVIISANYKNSCEIGAQLNEHGFIQFNSYFTSDWFYNLLMRYGYARIMQFKDKHKGQRCFIVGNGPSLRIEDLYRIKSEFAFATNKIYITYSQTAWRPSYYMVSDFTVLNTLQKDIKENVKCPIFYAYNPVMEFDEFLLNSDYYYYIDNTAMLARLGLCDRHGFSEEPFFTQGGCTVTYDCIQMAVYMGFKEIYLIGMDNSFPVAVKCNGELIFKDTSWHFSPDYGRHTFSVAPIDICTNAYVAAREYCESHGIKIRNATRGGELEVFERVDFDSLF